MAVLKPDQVGPLEQAVAEAVQTAATTLIVSRQGQVGAHPPAVAVRLKPRRAAGLPTAGALAPVAMVVG